MKASAFCLLWLLFCVSSFPLNIQTRIIGKFSSVCQSKSRTRTHKQLHQGTLTHMQRGFYFVCKGSPLFNRVTSVCVCIDSTSLWYSLNGMPFFQKIFLYFAFDFDAGGGGSLTCSQIHQSRWDQMTRKFIAYDLHNIHTHQTINWPLRPYRWGLCHSVIDMQWHLALRGLNRAKSTLSPALLHSITRPKDVFTYG